MISSYLELGRILGCAVFHTRLGLCVLDLARDQYGTTPEVARVASAILAEASTDIVATGIPGEMFHTGLDALTAWSARPDAALWHAICWAEGRRLA